VPALPLRVDAVRRDRGDDRTGGAPFFCEKGVKRATGVAFDRGFIDGSDHCPGSEEPSRPGIISRTGHYEDIIEAGSRPCWLSAPRLGGPGTGVLRRGGQGMRTGEESPLERAGRCHAELVAHYGGGERAEERAAAKLPARHAHEARERLSFRSPCPPVDS